MYDKFIIKKFEDKHGFTTPDVVKQIRVQNAIFNEYQPHILGLFNPYLIKPKDHKAMLPFREFIKTAGFNTIAKVLGDKYSFKQLEKAYSFFTASQTGQMSNYHHQELLLGLDIGLYQEIFKYYFAIAFDATANAAADSVTSLTYAHTNTGSNLILFVGVDIDVGTDDITGVTYNTVAMTRINTQQTGGVGNRRNFLYYLLAPATGANNIVISRSSTGTIRSASASYTDAKQSDVPDASNTNSAGGVTSILTTTTTIADNCWVVSHNDNDAGAPGAGAGLTIRGSYANGGIGDNNTAKTPAGAVSLTWTLPSGGTATCQASFAPVPPVVTTVNALRANSKFWGASL